MFVPHSVEMRSRGLRLIGGNRWVPVAVVERMQAAAESARIQRVFQDIIKHDPVVSALSSGRSWGDIIYEADAQHDAPFIAMSSPDFIAALKANKIPKATVARIFKAREEKKNHKPIVVPPPAPDAEYRYWKNEYTNFGHLYFSSEEQQQEALADLEDRHNGVSRVQIKSKYAALLDSDDE